MNIFLPQKFNEVELSEGTMVTVKNFDKEGREIPDLAAITIHMADFPVIAKEAMRIQQNQIKK